jgi:hypothetical protein
MPGNRVPTSYLFYNVTPKFIKDHAQYVTLHITLVHPKESTVPIIINISHNIKKVQRNQNLNFLFPKSHSFSFFFFFLIDQKLNMDFLKDVIKEEQSKKRKILDAVEKHNGSDKKTKYVSRAELERIREEEYRQKEKERQEKERQVMDSK